VAALLAALVCWTLASPVSAGAPRGAADRSGVRDELSRDPSEASLLLIVKGGMRKGASEYALFGDGRLRITEYRDEQRTLVGVALEYRLDELQMTDLNTLIVEGRLNRYDVSVVRQAETALRPRPPLTDAGLVSYRLKIVSAGPGDEDAQEIRKISFDLMEPSFLADAYPEIREYRAANDLLLFLLSFRDDAVRIDGEHD
jgi:hypothetical protein